MLFILATEEGLPGLHTVHRLDRLTSGVLIFARSEACDTHTHTHKASRFSGVFFLSRSSIKAREMEVQISSREVHKEYVARVVGEFPEGTLVCEEPIEVADYKTYLI